MPQTVQHTPTKPDMHGDDDLDAIVHLRGTAKGKVTRMKNYLQQEPQPHLSVTQVRFHQKKLAVAYNEFHEMHQRIVGRSPANQREFHDGKYLEFETMHDELSMYLDEWLENLTRAAVPPAAPAVNPLQLVGAGQQPLVIQQALPRISSPRLTCFRVRPRSSSQLMGRFPSSRVTQSLAFEEVGVDYAGPVMVKQGSRKPQTVKAYFAVFVCMTTKAVHLELVSDLTMEAFLAALQRFVGRRGVPCKIFSDNATNFKSAKSELHELFELFSNRKFVDNLESYCQPKEITWSVIPPGAPNLGGLREAALKSTKYHLKRTLKNALLTFEEYATVLTEVEAILNSRPLCAISSDPADPEILTPSHFLISRPLTAIPEPSHQEVPTNRLSRWQYLQLLREQFWRLWRRDYRLSLQTREKNRKEKPNLEPGMVVLLEENDQPPMSWPLAVVIKTYPGPDDLVCAVDVKTKDKVLKHPISKLYVLPIEDNQPKAGTASQPGGRMLAP